MTYPKIELHVHLEATVRPQTLLAIARRNGVPLPAESVEEFDALFRYRDFAHFLAVWEITTRALRTEHDFRRVVVDYARQAQRQGCVYVEGIFSPAEAVRRGTSWDELFSGYCDGAQEARERYGVVVMLTPDIPRHFTLEEGIETARAAVRYRDRGVVGLGLGGPEADYPPEPWEPAFSIAREGGIGSVPHAGEIAGADSVRGALEKLGADRIRHGIRAIEDAGLVMELAGRGTVLDVCLISNLRTGIVRSLGEHPLPDLVQAGVKCSLATDDPVLFGTNLLREHAAAVSLGLDPRSFYAAGVVGALCDEDVRARLRRIGDDYDWALAKTDLPLGDIDPTGEDEGALQQISAGGVQV